MINTKKMTNSKHFILDTTETITTRKKIKKIIGIFKAKLWKFYLNTCQVEIKEKRYKVSICAIFKNEEPYLNEWIEFNHIIGVDHFYLYNNNSNDDYLTVIEPYIQSGLVSLIQWPKNQAQMECYRDCITNFSSETKWIGFIDIDEFIVPKSVNSIYDILRRFEKNRGAVKIYWKMFGTSGLLERDLNGLVTEDFTVCWPKYYSVGKCFYNTGFEFNGESQRNYILNHLFWASYKGRDIPPVNVYDEVCFSGINIVKSDDHMIQINHYFSKSYKEYTMKITRGDAYFEKNPRDEDYFYLHEMENTSVDYSTYKYMTKLKMAIAREAVE